MSGKNPPNTPVVFPKLPNPIKGQVYTYKDTYHQGENRPAMVISVERVNHGTTVLVAPFSSTNLDEKMKYPWNVYFASGTCGL